MKVNAKEKEKAKNRVKEVVVKKEHGKPDKVKISQSANQKAKQRAKGRTSSTKTSIVTYPVTTVQDVMDALKKSTDEVVKISEETAQK